MRCVRCQAISVLYAAERAPLTARLLEAQIPVCTCCTILPASGPVLQAWSRST